MPGGGCIHDHPRHTSNELIVKSRQFLVCWLTGRFRGTGNSWFVGNPSPSRVFAHVQGNFRFAG
jgi:hypothetical protein